MVENVAKFEEKLDPSDNIYKGESDGEDLSNLRSNLQYLSLLFHPEAPSSMLFSLLRILVDIC